jgi:ribosomal protein S18 acetylase RimI-like enzyme
LRTATSVPRVAVLLRRIRDSLEREGARSTASKVLRGLVDRVVPPRQCLFWMPLSGHKCTPSEGSVSLRVVFEPAAEVDLAMLEKSLGPSTVSVFRTRLAQRCQLCVLAQGDTLAGTLFFVFGRDRPFQHLALTERDAVILDAWISPQLRGRGLYSIFLDLALSTLKGKGIERVFVATSERNQPSLRALRRVGFRYLLRYRTGMGIYTYDEHPL